MSGIGDYLLPSTDPLSAFTKAKAELLARMNGPKGPADGIDQTIMGVPVTKITTITLATGSTFVITSSAPYNGNPTAEVWYDPTATASRALQLRYRSDRARACHAVEQIVGITAEPDPETWT